jgi:Cold shock proteins
MPKAKPERQTGTVIKWMPEKGFGFIQGSDGAQYFFHRSAVITDVDSLQISDAVSFISSTSPKGPRAEDIELA